MPKKTVVSKFSAIHNNNSLIHNLKTMLKVFKSFLKSAESVLFKLPDPPNNYNLESVFLSHSNFTIPEVFHIFTILQKKKNLKY